jgi:hypothetical protein
MEEEAPSACRVCGKDIQLTAARRATSNRICTQCANRARDSDAARYLARKLADDLRRKGHSAPYPGVDFVRELVSRCGGRSAQSGRVANLRELRVVFRDPASGVSLDNALLLTSKESFVLSCERRRAEQEGRECRPFEPIILADPRTLR